MATLLLPDSAGGKSYNFTLAATDGAPPYTWNFASGSPPPSLSLDPSGRISGNVAPVGSDTTSKFTVRVTDSAATPQTDKRPLSILVHSAVLGRNDVCTPGTTAGTTAISNGRIRASISPYGDIDVYSFQLTTTATNLTIETFAQRLDIGTNLTTRNDFLDTVLELLDGSCSVIGLNDDLSANPHIQDSLIQVSSSPFPVGPFPTGSADKTPPTSLPAGTYFIRVRDFRGDGRPDFFYELSLSGAN